MDVTTVLLGLAVLLLFKWVWNRRQRQQKHKLYGLTGPKPNLLMGNFRTVRQLGYRRAIRDWSNGQYGKTCCYYEGEIPVVLSSDVELIRECLIKQFQNFSSRRLLLPVYRLPRKMNCITEATYTSWKRVRNILSPTFSAVRMKEMSPMINMCVDRFLKKLEDGHTKPMEFHDALQRMTLDVITTCAFGFDTDVLNTDDTLFLDKLKGTFDHLESASLTLKFLFFLTLMNRKLTDKCAPFLRKLFGVVGFIKWFAKSVDVMIDLRLSTNEKRIDLLTLMMNASETDMTLKKFEMKVDNELEELAKGEKEEAENHAPRSLSVHEGKKLTVSEMKGQCVVFFLAGYETTSTAMTLLMHVLAKNPDVQDKLQAEIDEHYPDKDNCRPDYEDIQKLKYLDMVINENLRYHLVAEIGRIRECVQPTTLGGFRFDVGECFQPAVHAVHHDPEHWGPEPTDQFVPERFLPERVEKRHPCAFIPFGAGPRNCIGLRFSLMEQKIALIRVLRHYRLETCPKTCDPVPTRFQGIYAPTDGVYLKVTPRS